MTARWLRSCLAIVLLMPLALIACEPERTPSNPERRCRARFVTPYRPVIASGRRIAGEAAFACRQPPTAHRATLYLELEQPSGAWQVKDQSTSTQVPAAAGLILRVIDDCRVGTWRLRIHVDATANGTVVQDRENSSFLRVRSGSQCDKVER